MAMSRQTAAGALAILTALTGWLVASSSALSQTTEIRDRSTLRVCADPANPPFSSRDEAGFENKIAELLADELDVPIQYTWFPMATGFVRNTLNARKCDVVIGISLGFELLQNTNPYYRSTYVMIYRADGGIAPESLADPVFEDLRLGVVAGTPPSSLVARHGLMAHTKPYHLMVDTRFNRPGENMVADVATGEIDVGLLWGPIAGYYAQQQDKELVLVPLPAEEGGPKMDYRITMGLRFNEPEWKHRLNAFIEDRQAEINAILLDFGMPLLDEKGALIQAAVAPETVAEPEGFRMADYRAAVPATLAGATVVDTAAVQTLIAAREVVPIDVLPRPPKPAGLKEGTVWRPPPRHNIPGTAWLANTGFGVLSPEIEAHFKAHLDSLSGGDLERGLLFYCQADCWMSWNAAKRALAYGYSKVYWYPEGTDGWIAAGLATEPSEPIFSSE